MSRGTVGLFLFLILTAPLLAQSSGFQAGFVPFVSYDTQNFDSVNLFSGNLVVNIPLISFPQRGTLPDVGYHLIYNNTAWFTVCYYDGDETGCQWDASAMGVGVVPDNELSPGITAVCSFDVCVYEYQIEDSSGAVHSALPTTSANTAALATDASGIVENIPSGGPVSATDRRGITHDYNIPDQTPISWQDPTGNTVTISTATGLVYTDSIGRAIPAPVGTAFAPREGCDIGGYSGSYCSSTSPGCYTVDYPGPQSGTSEISVCYANFTIATSFGAPDDPPYLVCAEYSGSQTLLQSVTLPNGTSWTFDYDSYGDLVSVSLPSGGQITYTWEMNWPYGGSAYCGSGATAWHTITQRTVSATSSDPKTWQYAFDYTYDSDFIRIGGTTTVTDPDGDTTVHTFGDSTNIGYETETQINDHVSGLLKTVDRSYYGYYDVNVVPKLVTTTWPNAQVSRVCMIYDNNGNTGCNGTDTPSGPTFPGISPALPMVYGSLLYQYEYDYGSGSPGSLLRKTVNDFAWLDSSAYLSGNLLDLPSSVNVYDGSSTQWQEATYFYDESGSASSGCSSSSPCGELTTVSRYANGSTHLDTHYHYNSNGMQSSMIDPKNNTTCYTYDSHGAYLSEIQYPNLTSPTSCSGGFTEYFSYDYDTGVLLSHTDFNSQTTSYSYDSSRRLTGVSYPDGGSDAYSYTDSSTPNPYFDFTKAISSGVNVVERGTVDGLGRPVQARTTVPTTTTCSGGYSYVVTTYDNEGRTGSVSNPDCSTSGATTSYQYDALGRIETVTEQDGSTITTSYTGSCVTVTDEAGKVRKSCADGPGRMTRVWEDPSSLNYETDYSYDPLDDLTSVTQSSSRTRAFGHDFLGRLTSASNPESGITYYYYTSSGGGLCAGDTSAVCRRTDGRSITTTYSYDALNRMTNEAYTDGTPQAQFYYDQTAPWGITVSHPVGRLTQEQAVNSSSTVVSSFIFGYDPMGRVNLQGQCSPVTCGWSGYLTQDVQYNYLGGLSSYEHPWGFTITRGYDAAGRVSQVTSSWSDSSHPGTLTAINSYWPDGTIKKASLGNGLTETKVPNLRLQPCRMNVNSGGTTLTSCTDSVPGTNIQDLSLGFNAGSSDNGNLTSVTATGHQHFTRNYAYDNLNRLYTMSAPSDPSGCTGLSWSYDAWGNRTAQTVTGGTCGSWSSSYDSYNHITSTGFSYDYAGNVTNDGSHSYFYDAENRLIQVDGTGGNCSTATACYTYDALGYRSEKLMGTTATEYVYDLEGHVAVDINWDCSSSCTRASSWNAANFYLNGDLFAEYTSSSTDFVHRDHLGSARLLTDMSGAVVECDDFQPFGEQLSYSGGSYPCVNTAITTHKFTGKERDPESNLDNFEARYYSSAQGRFMSPDPGNAGADPTSPQSWNMYSYVLNNPLSFTDPTGENCVWDDGSYDADDDAQTGNQNGCAGQGGTWINQVTGDWNPNPNADLAYQVNDIQNTPASATVNADVSGTPTLQDALNFYEMWSSGVGPSSIAYGANDGATKQLANSESFKDIKKAVCSNGNKPTGSGHVTPWLEGFGTANSTLMQVGGFVAYASTSGSDTTFTISNVASNSSFTGQSTWAPIINGATGSHINPNGNDNPNGPAGPKHNITQTFKWTEPNACQ